MKNGKEDLRHRQSVQLFYRWIEQSSLSCSRLSFHDLQQFFQDHAPKRCQRSIVLRHLRLVSADFPRLLLPGHLPPLARTFVDSLRTRFKPNTCFGYTTVLCGFHRFLIEKEINIEKVTRKNTSSFFTSLVDAGLTPATRLGFTHIVRTYLRWLHEQGIIHTHPQELVLFTDYPRRQSYLPRPLPAKLDRALQRRLQASTSIYHKGLLLMRHTGIRLGELVALPYGCVYTDSRHVHFLKVPLGKLDNERNVPLDKKTHNLLQKIQRMGPQNRPHLIPRRTPSSSTQIGYITRALRQIRVGLLTDAPITSHRMRHTYATSLLSAGVTLFGVMRLLGHRDYRMTLRYAAVTQESVLRDYFAAIKKLDYAAPLSMPDLPTRTQTHPITLLDETERTLKKLAADNHIPPTANVALLKKIARLRLAVHEALHQQGEKKTAKMAR